MPTGDRIKQGSNLNSYNYLLLVEFLLMSIDCCAKA